MYHSCKPRISTLFSKCVFSWVCVLCPDATGSGKPEGSPAVSQEAKPKTQEEGREVTRPSRPAVSHQFTHPTSFNPSLVDCSILSLYPLSNHSEYGQVLSFFPGCDHCGPDHQEHLFLKKIFQVVNVP